MHPSTPPFLLLSSGGDTEIGLIGFHLLKIGLRPDKILNCSFFVVREILSLLDSNLLKKLVVKRSAIGAGSPDYVRNLSNIITEDGTYVNNENTSQFWCVCGVSTEMPMIQEKKCCGRSSCIVS